jgi:integrase
MGNNVHHVKGNFTYSIIRAGEANAVSLFDPTGNRKYVTPAERIAFLRAAEKMPTEIRAFLLTLTYTGARISEVLALTPARIDRHNGVIVIESLKKRRQGVFRAVPVPASLLDELASLCPSSAGSERLCLWPWCGTTAWQHVKGCMASADIAGPYASPKALRHGFAVGALNANIPLTLVQKWLGHSRLSTTAIYANAVGDEERAIASRFWSAS